MYGCVWVCVCACVCAFVHVDFGILGTLSLAAGNLLGSNVRIKQDISEKHLQSTLPAVHNHTVAV